MTVIRFSHICTLPLCALDWETEARGESATERATERSDLELRPRNEAGRGKGGSNISYSITIWDSSTLCAVHLSRWCWHNSVLKTWKGRQPYADCRYFGPLLLLVSKWLVMSYCFERRNTWPFLAFWSANKRSSIWTNSDLRKAALPDKRDPLLIKNHERSRKSELCHRTNCDFYSMPENLLEWGWKWAGGVRGDRSKRWGTAQREKWQIWNINNIEMSIEIGTVMLRGETWDDYCRSERRDNWQLGTNKMCQGCKWKYLCLQ